MKHKVLLVATGFFVASAGITGGLVFGLSDYENKINAETERINIEAKNLVADYDNKDQIETREIDPTKIKFSGIDWKTYEISTKDVAISPTDSTELLVNVLLMKTDNKTYNKETTLTISGFKKPIDDKKVLNDKIKNVLSAKYSKDTSEILAKDAKEDEITFDGVELGYVALIKNLSVKIENQSILTVAFTIKGIEKDLESDIKILEIPGFKTPIQPIVPKTKSELDEVIENLNNLNYDGDKTSTSVSDIDQNKIKVSQIPNGFGVTILEVTPKDSDPSIAIIKFKVHEDGGSIYSNEKAVEIPGFSEPFLDKKQLDEAIEKITDVTYNNGDNSETKISDINQAKLNFAGLDDGLEAKILEIKPKNEDKTVAVITFTVNEKGKENSSKIKSFEIPGFKKPSKTKDELDKEIERISALVYSDYKANVEVKNIDKTKIIFSDLDNDFEPLIVSVVPKNKDTTVAIVKFKIKEKTGTIYSVEKDVEISDFKKQLLTKSELDVILNSASLLEYLGDKNITEVKDINKSLLIFPDEKPNIKLTIISVEPKSTNNTTAVINLKINELNSTIESEQKEFEIIGFKKPLKTKEELNEVLKTVVSLDYVDDKSTVEVSQILASKLIYNTLNKEYSTSLIEVNTINSGLTDTASVTFRIREKIGTIHSDEATLQITGFKKASKTLLDLKATIDKVTGISYSGNKAETEVKNIDKSLLVIQNLDVEYEALVTTVEQKNTDSTTAFITFKIKSKTGEVFSGEKTFEVSGFKKPALTKEQLDARIDRLISAVYSENTSTIEVKNIVKDLIIFNTINKEEFEVKITDLTTDSADKSVAIVTLKIKEKNGTIESKSRVFKIPGFKLPLLNWNELNEVVDNLITAQYAGQIRNTTVKDMNWSLVRLSGLDKSKFMISIKSITAKTPDNTTAIIKIRIKEKLGSIYSKEKTFEVPGFKKPELKLSELNKIIDDTTNVIYSGDRSKIEVKNIKKSNIKFSLNNSIQATVTEIKTKKGEPTTAVVKFKINEIGKRTFSKIKEIELAGFKKPPLTKSELNTVLNKISVNFNGEKSTKLVANVSNTELEFLIADKNIEAQISTIKPKDENKTIAVITFRIKEKGNKTFSDSKTIEISGFKIPPKTTAELNKILESVIAATYSEEKSNILVNNIDKSKVVFAIDDNIKATIVSFKAKEGNPTIAVIKFKINEVGQTTFSNEKEVEIEGFKKPPLTKNELNAQLNKITTIDFKNNKLDKLVSDITNNELTFSISNENVEVETSSISITPKTDDKTVAVVTFKIKEKGETTLSEPKSIEITGFKMPPKTETELNKILDSIVTATYNGKINNILVKDIEIGKFNFAVANNIEALVKRFRQKEGDPTTAIITFQVNEVGGLTFSKEKEIEIPGFKIPPKTTAELNKVLETISAATYSGDNEKTLVKNIAENQILFNGLNDNYSATITEITENNSNPGVAVIKFKINETGESVFSDEKSVTISGFLPQDLTLDELNAVAEKIKFDSYEGDKLTTTIREIDSKLLQFSVPNTRVELELKVIEINPKTNDDSTALITFEINQKDSKLLSKKVVVEASGFKAPDKTVEQLNEVVENIFSASYSENKTNVPVNEANLANISLDGLSEEFELEIESFEPKIGDETTGILTFHIKQKGKSLQSTTKTIEIRGFREPFSTQEEINSTVENIIDLSYAKDDGVKETTRFKDIDPKLFNIVGHYPGLIFEVTKVEPITGDTTKALVTFRIKEEGGKIWSKNGTKEVTGFQKNVLTEMEINGLLDSITEVWYEGDAAKTQVYDVKKPMLNFQVVSNLVILDVLSVKADPTDPGTAVIDFYLGEKGNESNTSIIKTLKLSGFLVSPEGKSALDEIYFKINLDFKNKESININTKAGEAALTLDKIIVNNLDKTKYEFVATKIDKYEERSVKVTGHLVEKVTGKKNSTNYLIIEGFDTPIS